MHTVLCIPLSTVAIAIFPMTIIEIKSAMNTPISTLSQTFQHDILICLMQ